MKTVPGFHLARMSVRNKKLLILGVPAGALLVFLLGPRADMEERWVEPDLPAGLDAYLAEEEARVPDIRPGDEKEIVWADPASPSVTPLSLVYLHGFSADRHEVEPVVSEVAEALGANVFFTRLRGHGRDSDAMGEVSAEDWLDDAAEAVAIGGYIGERVVLLGTSTGGTLAVWAATRPEAADRIAAVVLVSPNLGVRDPAARFLLWPWGGLIGRLVVGPERCFEPKNAEQQRHWTTCYPPRALLPMMALVDDVRSLPEGSLTEPTLVLYARGDQVVDANETERVMARLAGGEAEMHVVDGAGDPEQHVIAGAIMSPETTGAVRSEILGFLAPLAEASAAR